MTRFNWTGITAIATFVVIAIAIHHSLRAQETNPAALQPTGSFQFKGTFVVSIWGDHLETVALVDPSFQVDAGQKWLVGVVSERNGYIQDTPFTGGITYIPSRSIASIQQLNLPSRSNR